MSTPEKRFEYDGDCELLDLNLDSITKELNDLIVAPASSGQCADTVDSFDGACALAFDAEAFYRKNVVQDEKTAKYDEFSSAAELRESFKEFLELKSIKRKAEPHADNKCASKAHAGQPQKLALLCAALDKDNGLTPATIYDYRQVKDVFRDQNGNADSASLSKKKCLREKPLKNIDYDNIVVDLSVLGMSLENREANDVLRLFGLFRKLHYYLNDVIPKQPDEDFSKYFVKQAPNMPCTMNVRTQIRHAIFKCNHYHRKMNRKLIQMKYADHDKYVECFQSLNMLAKSIQHLGDFQTSEFEHKEGVFVNSFIDAKAKNLELQLTQLCARVRECNISIEVFKWWANKQKPDMDLQNMQTLAKAVAIVSATIKKPRMKPAIEGGNINIDDNDKENMPLNVQNNAGNLFPIRFIGD